MEWKKPCAIALGSLVLFGLGGLAGAYVKDPVVEKVEVPGPVVTETETVTEIVEADYDKEGVATWLKEQGIVDKLDDIDDLKLSKAQLDMVLDNLYEYEGDLDFIDFDDIDDDEKEKIVKYLDFVNQAKLMAIDYLEVEAFDELDGENYPGSNKEFDEDELEDLDVEDDLFKIGIVKVDWEDGDARVSVPFEFEDEDGKEFKAVAKIVIKDFEVDDMDIDDIEEIEE